MKSYHKPKGNIIYSKFESVCIVFIIIALLLDDVFNITGLRSIVIFGYLRKLLPGFDAYRFVTWFLLPVLCTVNKIDWKFCGFNKLGKQDFYIISYFVIIFIVVVFSINFIPGLKNYYPSKNDLGAAFWDYITKQILFLFSWILGWEYIFRNLLVRSVAVNWPKYGWIVIPIIESLYHFTKHPLEAIGMFFFSIILTKMAIIKQNCILPAAIHLILEIVLILFLTLC